MKKKKTNAPPMHWHGWCRWAEKGGGLAAMGWAGWLSGRMDGWAGWAEKEGGGLGVGGKLSVKKYSVKKKKKK